MTTGIPTGLGATLGFAAEVTPGTFVTPARWFQFEKESLKLKKKAIQGQGLNGSLFELASRRVYTNRQVAGAIPFDITDRSFGLLLKNMLGAVALGAPASGVTLQTHTPAALVGTSMSVQVGRPSTDGTIQPFSYRGLKVIDWEIACAVEQGAKLNLTFDGWDETTATAYTAPSFLAANPLTFAGGSVLVGGTVSTTAGITTVAGSPTTLATVKSASVKGQNPLDTSRFFLGSSVKKEQLDNGFRKITGQMDVEFGNLTDVYTAFSADTATAIQLNFVGPVIGGALHSFLNVLIPVAFFEEGPPEVDGPKTLSQKVTFTALDDDANNPCIQIQYSSLDAAA